MMEYSILNILDMVDAIGEDAVQQYLSDFSCSYHNGENNEEVEHFLDKNALEFAKRKMSITYLVLDDESAVSGVFTLTHKPVVVKNECLSKTARKKMDKHARYEPAIDAYNVSAFLIAQFSKNYVLPADRRISGDALMNCTLNKICDIQREIGGGIVFLECEDHEKLLDFYCRDPNMFLPFSERYSENDRTKYIQIMRFI